MKTRTPITHRNTIGRWMATAGALAVASLLLPSAALADDRHDGDRRSKVKAHQRYDRHDGDRYRSKGKGKVHRRDDRHDGDRYRSKGKAHRRYDRHDGDRYRSKGKVHRRYDRYDGDRYRSKGKVHRRYDRYDGDRYRGKGKVHHRYDRYDRRGYRDFVIPRRIHGARIDDYRHYRRHRAYFPAHRHHHVLYRFPVYTRYGVAYELFPYCDGSLYLGGSGRFVYNGRRVRLDIGF